MLFKEVLLWSPPHQSNTMTGPQNPAVSRHTFDKRLPGPPAKAIIIGLLDHLQLPKMQLSLVNGAVAAQLLITQLTTYQ